MTPEDIATLMNAYGRATLTGGKAFTPRFRLTFFMPDEALATAAAAALDLRVVPCASGFAVRIQGRRAEDLASAAWPFLNDRCRAEVADAVERLEARRDLRARRAA
ncbi:hypothetical protein V6K52_10085 [Knoellia sp. S7-12]|uniref:hypothetical protein n=1 Tax=Knoellia sp. S7-12 TaxID=3126698 RepID=UPI0033694E2F